MKGVKFLVYIKNDNHHTIYKHPSKITITSNQDSLRKNYLQDFISQQVKMNKTIKNTTDSMNMLIHETKHEQEKQYQHVIQELEQQEARTAPIIENMLNQDKAYKMLLMRLEKMEEFNHEILNKYENDGVVNQAIIDQLTLQDSAIQRLSINIEQYDGQHKSLSEQLEDQNKMYEEILTTLELQEAFHKTILERFDHQEALNQKMSRDLDSLRATIHERISYVIEKIEDNYKQVIGYVTNLFSRSGFIKKISVEREKKEKETIK